MICIIASSAPVFIIGRVVTGIGIAAGVPLCATILIDITSPGERATYMASCVGVDVISLAFGALLGGYLETNMDYRKYFKLSSTYPFSHFLGKPFLGTGSFPVLDLCPGTRMASL